MREERGVGEAEGGAEAGFEEELEDLIGEDDHAERWERDVEWVVWVQGEVGRLGFFLNGGQQVGGGGREGGVGVEVRGRGFGFWGARVGEVEEILFVVVADAEVIDGLCGL